MIVPNKHENLSRSVIVLGSDLLKLLKKSSYGIENLYRDLYSIKSVDVRTFYDTLTFLWLADVIEIQGHRITLTKKSTD